MAEKKRYIRPEVTKIELDLSIRVMLYSPPANPGMMMMTIQDGGKGTDSPFTSPFDDRPFS